MTVRSLNLLKSPGKNCCRLHERFLSMICHLDRTFQMLAIAAIGLVPSAAMAQIPPDNQLVRNNPDIVVTPGKYSAALPVVNVTIFAVINAGQAFPPFSEEHLELSANNTAPANIDIAQHCYRSPPMGRVLECQIPFELSPADAANPSTLISARLLVRKTSPAWQGYIVGRKLTTAQAGQGGAAGTGANSGGSGVTNAGGPCWTETQPLMPTTTQNGSFVFTIQPGDLCGGTFFIDPPVAVGYDFSVTGAGITKITVPTAQTVPDPDGYQLLFPGLSIQPVNLMPGQDYSPAFPQTEFKLRGIDPALLLDPSDQTAFAVGLALTPLQGPITITQTPVTGPPSPPPPPPPINGLGGDDITLLQQNNVNYPAVATVTSDVEFQNYGTFPLSANTQPPRWNIDIDSAQIRIEFVHPSGMASYGPGFVFNFKDLDPQLPGCTGMPIIVNGITTTSRSDVPFTMTGSQFRAHEVDIPLGPPTSEPGTTYDWAIGDWTETKLVFACAPPLMPPGSSIATPIDADGGRPVRAVPNRKTRKAASSRRKRAQDK